MFRPNRIRIVRQSQGLTQVDLAARSGFTQSELTRWESSKRTITLDQLVDLANALQCHVADLLDPSDNPDKLIDHERHWLALYRSATPAKKAEAMRLMTTFFSAPAATIAEETRPMLHQRPQAYRAA